MLQNSKNKFPVYTELEQKISPGVWKGIQFFVVAMVIALCVSLFVYPDRTLFLFWRVIIPVLPLVFLLALGLWRNICPLATLNQIPISFKFNRNLTLPKWLAKNYYLISISLFLIIVPARKLLFNTDGPALALFILTVAALAFVMGIFYKGKSGFCNSICPVLPVERIYGQTPFFMIRNSHCEQCVSCTKNCIDNNPNGAYLADLYDDDNYFKAPRKFFAGMFPGFIIAFYTLPDPPAISAISLYMQFALFSTVSAGIFFLIEFIIKTTTNKLTGFFGAAALNLYYWFNAPLLAELISTPPSMWFIWSVRVVVLIVTIAWLFRTYKKEQTYKEHFLELQKV